MAVSHQILIVSYVQYYQVQYNSMPLKHFGGFGEKLACYSVANPEFNTDLRSTLKWCVCVVCVFFPFILDIKFVGRTSRGHTGGRSHRISHPPSFCGACLNFSREKDSAIPFPRRP